LEADEAKLIQGFRDVGMQVDILTEEQLAVFQEAISDVIVEFKGVYGEEACTAFGLN